MSWGALPYWVYEGIYEHNLAMMSCAFSEEWFSGLSKTAPTHMYRLSKSVFGTYDTGGRNANEEPPTHWDSLYTCTE